MLSQYRIQSLRKLAEFHMPSTCEILCKTRIADGMGDYIETEGVIATVKCRLSKKVAASQINKIKFVE